ncbi:MAG TPA: hypothetical protein VHZ03_43610 [Trebonia sp.]|jgi:hypothetical protein|nr:hypothetical protein [Trebonia sp.]
MGDSMTRGWGTTAIVLMGCLAGFLASGTSGADVARAAPAAVAVRTGSLDVAGSLDRTGARGLTASATPAPGTTGGAAPAAVMAAACAPGLDTYNRTELCWRVTARVAVMQGTTRAGTVTFDLTHDIRLNPHGRDWAERITISAVQVTGDAAGMTLTLRASCASPCSTTARFPQGKVITDGLTGVIDYSDAVSARQADSARTGYQLSFVKAGDRSTEFTYQTPISYQCDDALPGAPAGCVFPAYTPYLMTLTSLPVIARDIYAAQRGPGHYGKPGGGHPLHRVTSSAAQAANYAAVCARSVVGPPPRGEACDEYPFRSTGAGGTAVSKANRRVAWVPAVQESTKNALITNFYHSNRVLKGDPFWVVV